MLVLPTFYRNGDVQMNVIKCKSNLITYKYLSKSYYIFFYKR